MPNRKPHNTKIIVNARKDYDEKNALLAKLVKTEAAKTLMADLESARSMTRPLFDQAIELARAGKEEEGAEFLRTKVQANQDQWFKALADMIALQQRQNDALVEQADKDYRSAFSLMLALVSMAMLVGLGLGWLVTRSITQPLAESVATANAIAAGDLSSKIIVDSTDETGQLKAAMKFMQDNLARNRGRDSYDCRFCQQR